MHRIRTVTVAALLASFVALQPATALADDHDRRRDRREDRWDRAEDRWDRAEDRWDRREDRRDRRDDRYDARNGSWDPVRDYRFDPYRHRHGRRMSRHDRVYRGSDNRYYCRRDDGTTGLVVGGIAGGVLGSLIAPRGSKALGAIIGAGAGAAIGRSVDDDDIVCR
jgi:hypothetical protein